MTKKNNLFGKRIRYFILFLRNLKLKKSKKLFNRNLIKNYFLFNFFLKTIRNNKFIFLRRSLLMFNNNNYFIINPIFNFKKQTFNLNLQYYNFLSKNEIHSFFLKNDSHFNIGGISNYGLNYYLISKEKINFNANGEDYKDIFKIKANYLIVFNLLYPNYLNYFFDYNLYILNLLELYKIIILLNLFKTI